MRTTIKLTIAITGEDFASLSSKLKPLHFAVKKEGLVWSNPYDPSQTLTMKPLTKDSPIYEVRFKGEASSASAILNRALGCFDVQVRQLHYVLENDNYNRENCRLIASRNWSESSLWIFECSKGVACLVMTESVTFHTRAVHTIARVNEFIGICHEYSNVFAETEPFDLFTFEQFQQEAVAI